MRKSSWAMGARRGRLSSPWLRFHGTGRADVYIIIRVRASGCGESALNPADLTTHSPTEGRRPSPHSDAPFPSTSAPPRSPDAHPPTSPPIPHRRPSLAPAQRHALPEHFRPPTQRRRTPAGCAMPAHRPHNIPRRRSSLAPAQRRALPEHFRSPTQPRRTPAGCAMHSSPTSPPSPRRRPSPAPAQRRALPAHFHSPSQRRHTPAGCAMHSPPKAVAHPRRRPSPSPSVPLRAQKNGTAQWMCDAECLGRPSLRSVIGVGEPRAVRRRCGALAWRVGLRPQPWALRSRRCGRVLRA